MHLNSWFLATMIALVSNSALASDSPYRTALGSSSAGMQVRDLEVRARVTGTGRQAVLASLSAAIAAKLPDVADISQSTAISDDEHSFLQGKGWTLDVRGDGNWSRFWAQPSSATAVALERRLSTSALDILGRQFIGDVLAEHIVLQSDEHLEVWRTSYELSVGGPVTGGVDRKVVANRIVYTRVVGDTAVIGPGSKVSVTFINDGRVTGFQYDWSTLVRSTTTTTRSASPSVIAGRLGEVAAKKQLSKGVTLEQFECGYYDVGALAQSSVPLQAGCMAKHVVRNGGLLQALISFIPASEAYA